MELRRLSVVFVLVLAACATGIPDEIRRAPSEDLPPSQVRTNPDAYVGKTVRWGGTIAGVENRTNETWLDVVARPLDSYGHPEMGGESLGRFVAKVSGFLDPAIYERGREVTVVGTVEGKLTRPIGEYRYTYVTVEAEVTKLWEPQSPRVYYNDPFYDPFYDPFWPARVYPWYAPYPFYPYWR